MVRGIICLYKYPLSHHHGKRHQFVGLSLQNRLQPKIIKNSKQKPNEKYILRASLQGGLRYRSRGGVPVHQITHFPPSLSPPQTHLFPYLENLGSAPFSYFEDKAEPGGDAKLLKGGGRRRQEVREEPSKLTQKTCCPRDHLGELELFAKMKLFYVVPYGCPEPHGLLSSWNVRSVIEELNFKFYSKLSNWKLHLNGHTCLVTTILGLAEITKGRETRWVTLWKSRKNYWVKTRVLTLRVWPRWQGRKTLSVTPPMGMPEL